jgi:hypothetical protein
MAEAVKEEAGVITRTKVEIMDTPDNQDLCVYIG